MELDKELVAKAEELKLDHSTFESNEDLQKAINEKLDDELDNTTDPEKLKEKLDFLKNESKKAFEARDKAKQDTRTLKKKLEDQAKELSDLKSKMDGTPDPEEYKSLKEKIAKIEKEKEEKELEKLDEVEKQKVRFQKQMDELSRQIEETQEKFTNQLKEKEEAIALKDKEVSRLRKVRLGAEIVNMASKYNAYNPEQIKKLLTDEFTYDTELETYTYIARKNGKIVDEKTVEERVKEFLEDPINDNLVRSEAKPGMGTKDKGKTPAGKSDNSNNSFSKMSKKTGEYDLKDPELIRQAEMKGLSVEDHIETLKIRDAKMNKIKGIKEDN